MAITFGADGGYVQGSNSTTASATVTFTFPAGVAAGDLVLAVAAVVGLKLKHISIERGCVFQDPREIKTKFRKSIETTFLPVGEDVASIVHD